jgi:hypothetical protein
MVLSTEVTFLIGGRDLLTAPVRAVAFILAVTFDVISYDAAR